MKKSIIWLLLIGMGVRAEEGNFYDFLSTMFLQSGEMKIESSSLLAQSNKKGKNKELDVCVRSVKEIEQKIIFAELLKKLHAHESMQLALSFDAIKQLDLIGSSAERATLAKCLKPYTVFGEVMAAKLLTQPLTDVAIIKQRQRVIKGVATHDALRKDLCDALEEIKAGQNQFFTFFNTSNVLDENVLKQVYGGYDWMQKQKVMLYISRLLTTIFRAFIFEPAYSVRTIGDVVTGWPTAKNKTEKTKLILKTPFVSLYEYGKDRLKIHDPQHFVKIYKGTVWEERAEDFKNELLKRNPDMTSEQLTEATKNFLQFQKSASKIGLDKGWKPTALNIGFTALGDACLLYCMYKVAKDVKNEHAILTNMQTRLMGAAAVERGLRKIDAILVEHPELADIMPAINKIHNLFITRGEVGRLLSVLESHTFVGEPSFFSNAVHILLAYKLMTEHKDVFAPALEAVGELDAFVAAARCVSNADSGLYTYATFVDSGEPVVKLEDFRNPLMHPASAVVNTVYLGVGYDRNMLITGPNGSGKSTNMKAIAYNILLAQTFGIVAARRAELTPFHVFNVYLSVQENLHENKSSFMAEAQLLNYICERVAAVPVGCRGFSIIDEGLRGTVAQEAAVRLSKAIESMIETPRSICVLATHLEEPTHIETTSNGKIANYYVGLEEPMPGAFVRTFKLIRGINRWWFEDAQKRGRFVDWLVKHTA